MSAPGRVIAEQNKSVAFVITHTIKTGEEKRYFANIMEGRTTEQKKALSEKVIHALKELLPAVVIISMNIRDFEKATYCNAEMIEIGDESG